MPVSPTPLNFTSEGEILAYWRSLCVRREVTPSQNLDLTYSLGDGWQYLVTLASPADSEALCVLGEDFVRSHSAMFRGEYEADHAEWCSYLGLYAELDLRRQVHAANASMNQSHSHHVSTAAFCCHSGCTLKVEYRRETKGRARTPTRGARAAAVGAASVVPSAPAEELGPASPTEPRSVLPSEGVAPDANQVVGYVHFTMEESPGSGAKRASKRLKRKRGECTGEYTKVSHIVVTRAHWRRGLGKLMLTAVMHRVLMTEPSYAREFFLTVIDRNAVAVRLYERLGFEVVGKNTSYVGNDRRQPVMWYQMSVERCEGGKVDTDEDVSTAVGSSGRSSVGSIASSVTRRR